MNDHFVVSKDKTEKSHHNRNFPVFVRELCHKIDDFAPFLGELASIQPANLEIPIGYRREVDVQERFLIQVMVPSGHLHTISPKSFSVPFPF